MGSGLLQRLAAACLLAVLPAAVLAQVFVVEDIRVEGLRRVSTGTVFNELPITVGDTVRADDTAAAIKRLFATGFFDDVRIERDGGTLVVVVEERPSIANIDFSGNETLKTEDLMESLGGVGFAVGRTFDPAVLNRTIQELRDSYFAQGRYSAEIEATVTPLERHRVGIHFDIDEGEVARIRRINIVGNQSFEEDDLLDRFESTTRTLFSWLTGADRYSKQKVAGDLERLRTHYLDRGYINFSVDSTQVSVTPDKRFIYITINVSEGRTFDVGTVELAGDLIVSPEELIDLVEVREGDVFNRSDVAQTSANVKTRLGDEGYAFANVNPVPEVQEDEGEVDLAFFIDPGQRVYVRRIEFRGNHDTRDEVLRREMRQLEGAWVVNRRPQSLPAAAAPTRTLQRGSHRDPGRARDLRPGGRHRPRHRARVRGAAPQRRLRAGPGGPHQRERHPGEPVRQRQLGVVHVQQQQQPEGVRGLLHQSLLPAGGGQPEALRAPRADGRARAATSRTTPPISPASGVNFGIPFTEYDRFHVGLTTEVINFVAGNSASVEVREFGEEIGEKSRGGKYLELLGTARWSRDTRDRRILPTEGSFASALAEVTLPGSEFGYYRTRLSYQRFFPITEEWILMGEAEAGYGDGFGGTDSLPLTSHFFAGGARSVRGFRSNSLGPRDTPCRSGTREHLCIQSARRPIGGDFLTLARTELIVPLPFVDRSTQFRLTGFLDAGNVFESLDDFDGGEIRYSTGFSTIWFAGIGIITTSWGFPLNDEDTDDVQRFQFTIGTTF